MIKRKLPLRLAVVAAMICGVAAGALPGMFTPLVATADAAPTVHNSFSQPSFADIFERVSPAVVNISVTKKADVRPLTGIPGRPFGPFGDDPMQEFFGHFFEGPNGPPRMMPSQALGSGLVLDSDGYVVTNNHVIDGADSITVTLEDGRELEATLIGTDPKTDLALLKVSSDTPLAAVTLGESDDARVGDWVLAIGNPFGLGGTATFGIISAIGRDIQSGPYDDYLQIDAPINSGNSGGPVFNADGEVIGVNTAIFSPNGGNVGIGFAIPAAQVKSVAEQLKENGHVTRGWLGVQIQAIDADLADNLGVARNSGVLVADVMTDSPAEKADVKVGDIITAFGGQKVETPKALGRLVADADPRQKVSVRVLRDGRDRELVVRLQEADSDVSAAASGESQSSNPASPEKFGLALAPLTETLRQQLGLDDDVEGLVVTGVQPGSVAGEKGVRRGDVILSVDGKDLRRLSDFESAVSASGAPEKTVRMLVRSREGQRFIAMNLA